CACKNINSVLENAQLVSAGNVLLLRLSFVWPNSCELVVFVTQSEWLTSVPSGCNFVNPTGRDESCFQG
ncbi:MAG: hypothetical protein WAW69_12525, partial [Polaromonas sp.]